MSIDLIMQYIFSGITAGSIYAVVAIGYNIIYNTTGIINFAQGEFLILGGMSAITFTAFLPLPLAILLAVAVTAVVGGLIDVLLIRRMKKPTVLNMIIVTIGLSIIIREIALHIWDEKVRSLPYFSGTGSSSIKIFGAFISPQVLWVLGITAIIVVSLHLFYKYTLIGRSMRACAANKTAARLMGIKVKNMITTSFMLSGAIGALAGCVISPISQTQYDGGTALAIKGFTVAIIGGLGNSTGALAGGLFIGILEAFSISVLAVAYKDAISIGILLIVLFLKPEGLFGKKEMTALKEF